MRPVQTETKNQIDLETRSVLKKYQVARPKKTDRT